MAVVVRCTGCRGPSQVGADTLGMLVMCPRCNEPFLALEEAAVVPRTAIAKPVRDSSNPPPRRRKRTVAEAVTNHTSPDPHDAPLPSSGGLPASVLFGFALLPLAIPLLWLIGPQLLAKPPALTLAAPASLAIAASVLCMAVVLTVDWSPMTRIKGVLILVGLSYFAGLSLYFLKREVVERVRDFFTPDDRWHEFHPPDRSYRVTAPEKPQPLGKQPVRGLNLKCFHSSSSVFPGPQIEYTWGSCADPMKDAVRWLDEIGRIVDKAVGSEGEIIGAPTDVKSIQGHLGRQWVFDLGERTRIVRVFRANGTLFYLAAEGDGLDSDPPRRVTQFFDSFQIGPPPGK